MRGGREQRTGAGSTSSEETLCMIISRTPLRMSFAGGGSDLPGFYRMYGGAVVSSAIDKYVYVNVNKKFDSGIRIAYSQTEEVNQVAQIKHPIVRAAMQSMLLDGGVEITTIADIPSKGTGLGSSSSFTVGLVHALSALEGRYVSNSDLAMHSCHIEIDLCKEPIGKQDQYAAAFGGFNLIEFKRDDSVIVSPIICQRETLRQIERNIVLLYTGMTRSASSILRNQAECIVNDSAKQNVLRQMVDLAYRLRDELQKNDPDGLGRILHENWLLKKSIATGISSSQIDEWYDAALEAGAIGGKILGAGGGGFLMLYAPQTRHGAIKAALGMLRPISVKLEPQGSRIIFYE